MTATRTHIAHGAFRLWHTFSSENLYTAQQGTTRNLMDYNGTNAELYKYQWDYIHNPQQGIVRWLVDEEESELLFFDGLDFLDIVTINYLKNEFVKYIQQSQIQGFGKFLFTDSKNQAIDFVGVLFVNLLSEVAGFDDITKDCVSDIWNSEKEGIKNKIDEKFLSEIIKNLGNKKNLTTILENQFRDILEKESISDKMSECLVDYAITLCSEVASLNESQKQTIFETDSRKTVGILLYEFATGTGLSERTFSNIDKPCPFVDMYTNGRITDEIKEDLKKALNKRGIKSYDEFKRKGYIDDIGLELTPDPEGNLGFANSIIRHIKSNLEQMFIGGAVATIYPTEQKDIVRVQVTNKTSRNSLLLHVASNTKRDNAVSDQKLSTITQVLIFNITIDEEIFD